jgi:hypothetical protein
MKYASRFPVQIASWSALWRTFRVVACANFRLSWLGFLKEAKCLAK